MNTLQRAARAVFPLVAVPAAFCLALAFWSPAQAAETFITPDGRTIILRDDGRYEIHPPGQMPALTPAPSNVPAQTPAQTSMPHIRQPVAPTAPTAPNMAPSSGAPSGSGQKAEKKKGLLDRLIGEKDDTRHAPPGK